MIHLLGYFFHFKHIAQILKRYHDFIVGSG